MSRKIIVTSLLVIISNFLVGYLRNQPTQISDYQLDGVTMANHDFCMQPLETFSYKSKMEFEKPIPGETLNSLPLSPWQIETELPFSLNDFQTTAILKAVRTRNGDNEIWILRGENTKYLQTDHDLFQFEIFNSKKNSWKTISARVDTIDGVIVFVQSLYALPDGSIWGINTQRLDRDTPYVEKPSFSEYNEITERFEFVKESQGFPSNKIVLDPNGVFWSGGSGGIYSFSPEEKILRKHFDIPEDIVVSDIAIDSAENFYFTDYNGVGTTLQDETLYQYSVETGILDDIYLHLPAWPMYSSLFVDAEDSLWLGAIAWREVDGTLNQIHPSPIFITNAVFQANHFRWRSPDVLLESSDGRIWFTSDNGLAWADRESGQWCWFTTEKSIIVEDNENQLWVFIDQKLYSYALNGK